MHTFACQLLFSFQSGHYPVLFLHLPLIGFSLPPKGPATFVFFSIAPISFASQLLFLYNVFLFPLTTNPKKLKISSAPYYPPSSPNPGHIPAVH
jgi:hypothetical protein